MMKYLQRLGKSLMLPVACLPVAGILIGIGYWLTSGSGGGVAATFLIEAGSAVINNIPIIFAIGISVGMSDDRNGTSALAGLVCWLVVITLLSPGAVEKFSGKEADAAFEHIENVFTAILSGTIGAFCYNKFKNTKLPDALAFFSGKRSVAIVSAGMGCVLSLFLLFAWPFVYNALIFTGEKIVGSGAVGAGCYVFLNRLLIPFGLHHALNQVFWFDVAGINDLGNFWSGQGILGETGQYMSGFFPIMMFGLPAAALAMYHTAKPTRKKAAGGILLAAAISSFLTGVTEPLEFSFMFLAPGLYLVHAVLSGVTAGVVAALPVRAGFNFSAGLVDYLLSFKSPMALNPLYLIWIGLIVGLVYYLVFRWVIQKFNLKTIGREDETDTAATVTKGSGTSDATDTDQGSTYSICPEKESQATAILNALGGADNIVDLDNCATRLRVEIKDRTLVRDTDIKACGVAGIIHTGEKALQIVVGPKVQFLADEIKQLLS